MDLDHETRPIAFCSTFFFSVSALACFRGSTFCRKIDTFFFLFFVMVADCCFKEKGRAELRRQFASLPTEPKADFFSLYCRLSPLSLCRIYRFVYRPAVKKELALTFMGCQVRATPRILVAICETKLYGCLDFGIAFKMARRSKWKNDGKLTFTNVSCCTT